VVWIEIEKDEVMVKVVSVEAMRQIEQAANEAGLSFETMFEQIGRASCRERV
jgi:hypothetical protein